MQEQIVPIEHSVRGLEQHEVYVEGEEIRLMIREGSIPIGSLSDLHKLKPYRNGSYKTENGFEIKIEAFVNHMAISDGLATEIKQTSREPVCDGGFLTERMCLFASMLDNRLCGEVASK